MQSRLSVVEQRLASTRLQDCTSVAYATAGRGPLLLFLGGWLSNLELSWNLPAERAFLEALAHGRTLVRYDRPGCGLSGPVSAPTLTREVEAVSAVVEAVGPAAPVDVVASSLGVPVAIRWAARHPGSVRRLALYGGWVTGSAISDPRLREHLIGLVETHWGLGSEVLTDIFAPDAAGGSRAAFADYQRQCCSGAFAADLLRLCHTLDVSSDLAAIRAPTLVLHRDGDRAAPGDQSRQIAEGIAGSTLKTFPGRSHLPYIGEVGPLIAAIRSFLGLPSSAVARKSVLTPRQWDVAALVSEGMTNREIGARLDISERSAEGHVERIRLRLGVRSRAQLAAWWASNR